MTTYDRLETILTKDYNVPPEKMQPAARLEELGIDSLGVMELLFKIEDEFGITVPPEQVDLATVDDVVAYIDRMVAQQAPAAAPGQAVS